MTMGPQGYIDLQNSRRRSNWWKNNKAACVIAFSLAITGAHHADKETNFVNIVAARLTKTTTSKVPFAYKADQWADRQWQRFAAPLLQQ